MSKVLVRFADDFADEVLFEFLGGVGRVLPGSVPVAQTQTDRVQPFLDSLLDDHAVEKTGKKDFLVLDRIGVVDGAVTFDKRVKLADHEDEHAELVGVVLLGNVVRAKMRQDDLAEELSSGFLVANILRQAQDRPELGAQECASARFAVEVVCLVCPQKQLHSVDDELLAFQILLAHGATDNALVNLAVVGLGERLQDHDNRHKVLVLAV